MLAGAIPMPLEMAKSQQPGWCTARLLPLSDEVTEMDYVFRAMELMAHLASVMRIKMLHPFDTVAMATIEANLLKKGVSHWSATHLRTDEKSNSPSWPGVG
jgi:hypothetical protein